VNDEFDADLKIQKQYLLYHPSEIILTFTNGTDKDSIVKLPVNIGVMNEGDFGFTARTKAYSGWNHLITDGMPAADGGTGSVYKLGFAPVYLKSNFTYPGKVEYVAVTTPDVANIATYYEYNTETKAFSLTTDTALVEGKTYFDDQPITKDFYFFGAVGNYKTWAATDAELKDEKWVLKRVDDYTKVSLPVDSAMDTYYELVDEVYVKTADTKVYNAVTTPDVANIKNYFEYNEETKAYSVTKDTALVAGKTYYTTKDYYTMKNNPVASARLAPGWASCVRIYKNETGHDLYINLADWSALGFNATAAAVDAYRVFAIGADGKTVDQGLSYYALTADTELASEKTYYAMTEVYDAVTTPEKAKIASYYEYNAETEVYSKTKDTDIDATKTYYTKGENVYNAVTTPDVANIATYYEEITNDPRVPILNPHGLTQVKVPAGGYLFSPAYLDYVNLDKFAQYVGQEVSVLSFEEKK
jgi:hypothetical protein